MLKYRPFWALRSWPPTESDGCIRPKKHENSGSLYAKTASLPGLSTYLAPSVRAAAWSMNASTEDFRCMSISIRTHRTQVAPDEEKYTRGSHKIKLTAML